MYCHREVGGGREAQGGALDGDGHVAEAGVAQEGGQRIGVVHREHGTDEPADLRADMLDERPLQYSKAGQIDPGVLITALPPSTPPKNSPTASMRPPNPTRMTVSRLNWGTRRRGCPLGCHRPPPRTTKAPLVGWRRGPWPAQTCVARSEGLEPPTF